MVFVVKEEEHIQKQDFVKLCPKIIYTRLRIISLQDKLMKIHLLETRYNYYRYTLCMYTFSLI